MAAEKNRARVLAILGIAGGLTLVGASVPAEAQVWGGWFGGWRSEPAYAPPIPVRRVAAIVASNGYTLAGTPRRQGGVIIADAVDPRGEHMHFVLDAYDGQIIRTRVAGPPRPPGFIANAEQPAAPQAHAALAPNGAAPAAARPPAGAMMGGAQPGLEPPHPLAKPKAAPKPKQVAAHTPAKPAATPVAPKVPSEAEHVTAPAVSVPAPTAEAKAPEALAPEAAPAAAAAAPAPAMVEAKAPVAQPATDIGPAVKKIDATPTGSTPAPAAVSAPDFTDESK